MPGFGGTEKATLGAESVVVSRSQQWDELRIECREPEGGERGSGGRGQRHAERERREQEEFARERGEQDRDVAGEQRRNE